MGLDMYAGCQKLHRSGHLVRQDNLHYWRKHYGLCDWLELLNARRGGEEWQGSAFCVELSPTEFEELAAAILADLLPYHPDAAWFRDGDLAFLGKARAAVAVGMQIVISGDW